MDAFAPHSPPATGEELAGEAAALTRALGSPDTLASLTALAELIDAPRPVSLPDVRAFLARYRERLLTPVELPAIRDAFEHARRGEAGVVELDRRPPPRSAGPHSRMPADGSAALRCDGFGLRDRTLRRYLRAVENGEATGWHVVVFGLLLALFALPLRQALVHYAARTQEASSNRPPATWPPAQERHRLRDECTAPSPPRSRR
jgi:hypothetical protein